MSVLYPEDSAAWRLGLPTPWSCVECGEPVTPPCVHWQGARTLLLHPQCATRVGVHLISDAREATLAGNPEPHWRERDIATVRYRLGREEHTRAERARAKRDRVCARCRAELSGSDTGTMGQWLCIWCRVAERQAEKLASAGAEPRG